jgi:hypothetical protein
MKKERNNEKPIVNHGGDAWRQYGVSMSSPPAPSPSSNY